MTGEELYTRLHSRGDALSAVSKVLHDAIANGDAATARLMEPVVVDMRTLWVETCKQFMKKLPEAPRHE